MRVGIVAQPPPAPLHIDQQVSGTIFPSHRLIEVDAPQAEIQGIHRAYAAQESREAVRLYGVQSLLKESPAGMLHLQVEERPIDQPVEDICRIDKTKALPAHIAKISLCEIIFQSGHHLTCRIVLVKVERPHPLQVSSDLRHPELRLTKSDAVHFLQVSQQCVGTAVHPFPVDPNKRSVAQIIAFHPTIHQH